MTVTYELSLPSFKFWSGAADNAKQLSYSQLEELENVLEDYFGTDQVSETDINDAFWFDFENLVSFIGLTVNEDGDIIDEDEVEDEEEFDDEEFEMEDEE
jgi:hypothetical protein